MSDEWKVESGKWKVESRKCFRGHRFARCFPRSLFHLRLSTFDFRLFTDHWPISRARWRIASMTLPARGRLVLLWLSQTARTLADACLGTFLFLSLFSTDIWPPEAPWIHLAAWLAAPALLAPLLGAVSNQLAKPLVLAMAAAYSFGLVVLFTWTPEARLLGWGFLGVGAALAQVAYQALLPAAAEETHTPLSRLNSRFIAGAVIAIAVGFWIGADWQHD